MQCVYVGDGFGVFDMQDGGDVVFGDGLVDLGGGFVDGQLVYVLYCYQLFGLNQCMGQGVGVGDFFGQGQCEWRVCFQYVGQCIVWFWCVWCLDCEEVVDYVVCLYLWQVQMFGVIVLQLQLVVCSFGSYYVLQEIVMFVENWNYVLCFFVYVGCIMCWL